MNDLRKAAQQALKALENSSPDQYPEDAGVFYDAKEALRAALEQPEQEPVAWQSIETAPRDGTAILVMRDIWPGTESGRADGCNGHNTYVAAWWADEGVSGVWVCYMDQVHDPICPIEPTHWMPLPSAPGNTHPPRREWKNLTIDELIDLEQTHASHESLSRAIEKALKEKNQ